MQFYDRMKIILLLSKKIYDKADLMFKDNKW